MQVGTRGAREDYIDDHQPLLMSGRDDVSPQLGIFDARYHFATTLRDLLEVFDEIVVDISRVRQGGLLRMIACCLLLCWTCS